MCPYIAGPNPWRRNRSGRALSIGLLVVLPAFGACAPRGTAVGASDHQTTVTGVSNTAGGAARDAVIRDVDTITGLVDRHPLIGRKVDLHTRVVAPGKGQAFWIGEQDNRVLVIPRAMTRIQAGRMTAIVGSIQKLSPEDRSTPEAMRQEPQAAAAMGVYLLADTVSAQ